MNKDKLDSISSLLGEVYGKIENAVKLKIVEYLSKHANIDPDKWQLEKLQNISKLKNELDKIIKQATPIVKEATSKAVRFGLNTAIENDKLTVSQRQSDLAFKSTLKAIQEQNAKDLIMLSSIGILQAKKEVYNAYAKEKEAGIGLYKSIQQTITANDGVANVPKVVYSDGKQFSWKSYTEMNVRTTMTQKCGDYQVEVSRSNGVVFYMSDVFPDCAKDHLNYQGKVIYDSKALSSLDEEKRKQCQEYIDSHECYELSEVRDNKPFLTTRPNCRHRLMPFTTEQIITNTPRSLLEEQKMVYGKVDSENYKLTQRQRYNERTIRKYKERSDELGEIIDNCKDPKERSRLLDKKVESEILIKEWQKRNRILIKKHPGLLERDYRRESYKVVINDNGVRYNT